MESKANRAPARFPKGESMSARSLRHFGVLALAALALAMPARAQTDVEPGGTAYGLGFNPLAYGPIAPAIGGDIGLFTVTTADTLPAGGFSLGLYLQNQKLVAGDPLDNQGFPLGIARENRFYGYSNLQFSLGYGLTDHFELFASAGEDRFESRGGWIDGDINGNETAGSYTHEEPQKIRVGGKVVFGTADSNFRLAVFAAAHAPVGNDNSNFNTSRTDWEWGASATTGIFTGEFSYVLSGERQVAPNDFRVPNRLRFAVGVDVPIKIVQVIAELDRTVFDGGDVKPDDYSMLVAGARIFIGKTGIAVSAAVNANIDMLARTKFGPSPIGGMIGVSYSPYPPPPPPQMAPAPAEPPVVEQQPAAAEAPEAEAAPPPAPVEEKPSTPPPAAPPPPAPKTTTDEIYFDAGKARLTNIAKAILDGVALRMKNDLNSTAVITGYSDNTGTEQENMKISQERAEAAKQYLVARHGIDAGRIKTAAKGSSEPAYDNSKPEGQAKNRRAVIVVTLVSAS
jgi:outer membrane protein OmpA-like peptidoglycan-associated protein